MHNPPLSVIETWPTPNYSNPSTRGGGLLAINSVFIALVLVVVALRLFTRLRITGSFGADDILIGLALVPTIGLTVAVILADRRYGWNRHVWDIPPTHIGGGILMSFIASILFAAASWLIKTSLLCFYRRLLTSASYRVWNVLIIGAMMVCGVFVLSFILSLTLLCRPTQSYWQAVPPLSVPDYPYYCDPNQIAQLTYVCSVINTVLDFVIMLLPIPLIWNLKLGGRQRIAVVSLFSLGLVVCTGGIFRTIYVDLAMVKSYDETWVAWPLWIATAVEIDLAILCASIPALRPLIALYLPRLLDNVRPISRARSRGNLRHDAMSPTEKAQHPSSSHPTPPYSNEHSNNPSIYSSDFSATSPVSTGPLLSNRSEGARSPESTSDYDVPRKGAYKLPPITALEPVFENESLETGSCWDGGEKGNSWTRGERRREGVVLWPLK